MIDDEDKPEIDVTNDTETYAWLSRTLGYEGLSGFYRRSGRLVQVPRIGEDGYKPPRDPENDDGEAKVIDAGVPQVRGTIADRYRTYKMLRSGERRPTLIPADPVGLAVARAPAWESVPYIRYVTHTPYLRTDGTVNSTAGYDSISKVLYLPDPTLVVPPVPDEPSPDDVAKAARALEWMLWDFRWEIVGDRANYLAALLTPPLRLLLPPPYPLFVITAPMLGSGKTLLTNIIKIVHGGVFRSKMPDSDEEIRKQLTTILRETTSPVVAWDNATTTIRSGHLASLLTSREWSDRALGANVNESLTNDRIWIANGNNVEVGGDIARRCIWSGIDAELDRPWERPAQEFACPDLEHWVSSKRGPLIWCVLVIARAWVLAGGLRDDTRSDSFAGWSGAMSRLLGDVGLGEGFYSDATMRQVDGADDDDLGGVLEVFERLFTLAPFLSSEAVDRLTTTGWDGEMPDEMKDKRGHLTSRSIGDYLRRNQRRRAGGRWIEKAGEVKHATKWLVQRSA